MHFRWHRAVNRRIVSLLFCLPFANRASDSGDLYIDFDRNHLIFPVACLVCQVTSMFIIFLPEHAYASHTASRISYHVHVLVVYYVVCFLFRCLLLRVGSDYVVLWGSVRLRPFVFFMDSFFFLAKFQARWPYPRNHFYLCLLDARSFAMPMLRYLPLAYHASHIVEPSL